MVLEIISQCCVPLSNRIEVISKCFEVIAKCFETISKRAKSSSAIAKTSPAVGKRAPSAGKTFSAPWKGVPAMGKRVELRTIQADMLVERFEEERNLNPNTETMEFSLRDPDGYFVTVSAF